MIIKPKIETKRPEERVIIRAEMKRKVEEVRPPKRLKEAPKEIKEKESESGH